jgi:23S rRNA-/tRNA-specific pseudouridylate synthase
LALVLKKGGKFELPDVFTIENRLDKVGTQNGKAKMGSVLKGGDFAKTEFRVVEGVAAKRLFLIEARPITGRTHQIRVHLSEKNLPILGDRLYGGPSDFNFSRIFLHAYQLEFSHPLTGAPMVVKSLVPQIFKDEMEGRHVVR